MRRHDDNASRRNICPPGGSGYPVRRCFGLLFACLCACAPRGEQEGRAGEDESVLAETATGRIGWGTHPSRVAPPITAYGADGSIATPESYRVDVKVDDPWVETTATLGFKTSSARGVTAVDVELPLGAVLREVRIEGDEIASAYLPSARDEGEHPNRIALPPVLLGDDPSVVVRYTELRGQSAEPVNVAIHGLPSLREFAMHASVLDRAGREASALAFERENYEPSADMRLMELSSIPSIGLCDESRAVFRTAAQFAAEASPVEGLAIVWDTSLSRSAQEDGVLARMTAVVEGLAKTRAEFPVQVYRFDDEAQLEVDRTAGDEWGWLWSALSKRPGGGTNLEAALRALAKPGAAPRVLLVTDGEATVGARDPQRLAALAGELASFGVKRIDVLAQPDRRDMETLLAITGAPGLTPGVVLDPKSPAESILYGLTRIPLVDVPVEVEDAREVWPKTIPRLLPGDEVIVTADGVSGPWVGVQLGDTRPGSAVLKRRPRAVLDEALDTAVRRDPARAQPRPLAALRRRPDIMDGWITWWDHLAQTRYAGADFVGSKVRPLEPRPHLQLALMPADDAGETARRYGSVVDLTAGQPAGLRWAAMGLLGLEAKHRARARDLLTEAHRMEPDSFAGARLLAWATLETNPELAFEIMVVARDTLGRTEPYRYEAHPLVDLELSILAAMWWHRAPSVRAAIEARLRTANVARASKPVALAVASWEGQDVDVDLQVRRDDEVVFYGNRRLDETGGLITDSTSGSLPEAFVQRGRPRHDPATLSIDCRDPGDANFCAGALHLIFYDGRGHLQTRHQPWVIRPGRRAGPTTVAELVP